MPASMGACSAPGTTSDDSVPAGEDMMRDSTASDSEQRPFSDRDMIEARRMDETLKRRAVHSDAPLAAAPEKSYYDTRWPLVNQALALTERLTGGRAGLLQRLFTYLLIGG